LARPSKLTADVRLKVCDAIRVGATFEEACRHAGIAPSTGWEWRARGEGRDPRRRATTRHVLFAEAVAQAEKGFADTVPFCEFRESVEGFADAQTSEGAENGHDPGTSSRRVQAHEPFAERQNRCETGDAPAKASESQRNAEFAEPGFPDAPRDRARAREKEGDGVPSERAWLSQRSRRTSILDIEF